MEKEELKKVLIEEKTKYANKSFDELVKINNPITYKCNSGENWYQVEIQLLEKTDNYVHILIAVDDGKIPMAISPLSDDFILYKNGKIED